MVEIITYSLMDGHKNSDSYYRQISDFADEFLSTGKEQMEDVVNAFKYFLGQTQVEAIRPDPEYLLDLLTLGVLWRVYAPGSGVLKKSAHGVLTWLVYLRRNYRPIKPLADALRGVLSSLWLVPGNHRTKVVMPSLENLETLLKWLEAAGDFKEGSSGWKSGEIILKPFPLSNLLKSLNGRSHLRVGSRPAAKQSWAATPPMLKLLLPKPCPATAGGKTASYAGGSGWNTTSP